MSKYLVIKKLAYSGDVDNIYIVEAANENEAVLGIKDSGGFVGFAVNLDEIQLPYKAFLTIDKPTFNGCPINAPK